MSPLLKRTACPICQSFSSLLLCGSVASCHIVCEGFFGRQRVDEPNLVKEWGCLIELNGGSEW
ncbi:hypothetical protein OUZ56_017164 [Daphnia magna]|uniref:Secreted protein n=1 Tax=Daphnia magna TaxID=35525 RepID=A0ABR0ASD3_9CRUS|nr:hypothetical protein OUZ56_017164 [Daphnia magna]